MLKQIAVINDLSAFGGCSLSAAMAVLSAAGHRACPLPTAAMSAQSEFHTYAAQDLTAFMPRCTAAWLANGERFDGVCTGYFADSAQLAAAEAFLDSFQTAEAWVLVDPVMGDNGALYPAYDRLACAGMKRLAARADVLTPNLTELCLLTDSDYAALAAHSGEADFLERIAALAMPLAAGRGVVVTGLADGDSICNLVIENNSPTVVRAAQIGGRFSGTGDLFAAAVCACVLHGETLHAAAATAARFISQAVRDTVKRPHDPLYGVDFENHLSIFFEVKQHADNKIIEKK